MLSKQVPVGTGAPHIGQQNEVPNIAAYRKTAFLGHPEQQYPLYVVLIVSSNCFPNELDRGRGSMESLNDCFTTTQGPDVQVHVPVPGTVYLYLQVDL